MLREGFVFAQLKGFLNVVMEVDCSEVVDRKSPARVSRSIVALILGIGRSRLVLFRSR